MRCNNFRIFYPFLLFFLLNDVFLAPDLGFSPLAIEIIQLTNIKKRFRSKCELFQIVLFSSIFVRRCAAKKNAFKYKATVVMKRKYFVIPGMNILRTLDYFWK